jgi:hypothetical protein
MNDQELLDLLRQIKDEPIRLDPTVVVKPAESAYDLAQREFDADQAEYEEEMRLLSGRNDDQEAWKDLMREQGRA